MRPKRPQTSWNYSDLKARYGDRPDSILEVFILWDIIHTPNTLDSIVECVEFESIHILNKLGLNRQSIIDAVSRMKEDSLIDIVDIHFISDRNNDTAGTGGVIPVVEPHQCGRVPWLDVTRAGATRHLEYLEGIGIPQDTFSDVATRDLQQGLCEFRFYATSMSLCEDVAHWNLHSKAKRIAHHHLPRPPALQSPRHQMLDEFSLSDGQIRGIGHPNQRIHASSLSGMSNAQNPFNHTTYNKTTFRIAADNLRLLKLSAC